MLYCSYSLVTFSKNVELTPRMQKKTTDLLRYWGARMPQISHSYPRSSEQTDLSESVHARWVHTGGAKMSAGQCLIFDLVEAIQSQVIHITPMSSTYQVYLLIFRERQEYYSKVRDCNKTWVLPPRNKIFDLEHPMYNGGRYSNLYKKSKPVRSISFGDSTISEHDTHREDRPSSSALPPADRRTVIHLGGEISAKDLLQRPSSEAWGKRLLRAQNEKMLVTKKPLSGLGGNFVFEVSFLYSKLFSSKYYDQKNAIGYGIERFLLPDYYFTSLAMFLP